MLKFKTEKVTNRVTRIYAFAGELMYLVEGDEKAALLDTGSGFGSLKACVSELTDKPVIVLITHGHIDHAMGAIEFDEVYMSHKDEYIYREHADENLRFGGLDLEEMAKGTEFEKETDLIKSAPFELFRDLKDGDRFDLGGVHIAVYECAGHTKGTVVMLLEEERSLLTGDACNYHTFMFDTYSTSITQYEESLKELLEKVRGKYDTVYISHGDGKAHKELLKDVIDVCEDIKNGNTDDVPFTFMDKTAFFAKEQDESGIRKDGKRGNIIYSKDRIFEG